MYSPSFMRYNALHSNDLQRYLYQTVDYYSKDSKFFDYAYKSPAIGYFIVRDFVRSTEFKVRYIINHLIEKSNIAVIVGDAGTGKTALAHWLAVELHRAGCKRPLCFIRDDIPKEYPEYIEAIFEIDEAKPNSIIFYDEAALRVSSRRSMSKENIQNLFDLAIRRHKGWSICYLSQHTSFLDISILRMANCFFFRKLTWEETMKEEKKKAVDLLMKYVDAMEPSRNDQTLFWDGKEWMKFTNTLPYFWTDELSRGYRQITEIDAVDLCVSMHKAGVNTNAIKNRMKLRGFDFSPSEIKSFLLAPEKTKRAIKAEIEK